MLQRETIQKLKLDAASCEFHGKSADPILHRESPLLKNRSDATGDFKDKKSVGLP
jgi:hypothetical protein